MPIKKSIPINSHTSLKQKQTASEVVNTNISTEFKSIYAKVELLIDRNMQISLSYKQKETKVYHFTKGTKYLTN